MDNNNNSMNNGRKHNEELNNLLDEMDLILREIL